MSSAILFYGQHREYPEFSNFYVAPIELHGKQYATVEHYFQACKAQTRQGHEKIRKASTAAQAKRLGREVSLRPGWESIKAEVMRQALMAKFTQHEDLQEILLATGDRVIHEASPTDPIWGWMEGSGQDLLGKLLMEVRKVCRAKRVVSTTVTSGR